MNDTPRQILKDLVQRYGRDICQDARRCEALLRDMGGEYKREIFVLISALEAGTVDDLFKAEGKLPFSVTLPRLAQELHEATALSQEAARWAILAWAEALNIVTAPAAEALASQQITSSVREAAVAPAGLRLVHRWTAHNGEITAISFSPDGHQIASVGMDAVAHIWDVATAQAALTLTHRTGVITSAAWHPDGLTLALGSGDTGIYLWRWTDAGGVLPRLRGHKGPVTGLAFLTDGQRLISCSHDHVIHIWEPETGAVHSSLQGHAEAIEGLALSADGRYLASAGGWESLVRVWDLDQGREIFTLTGHTGKVTSVAWAAQSPVIASGGWDETIRLWQAAQGRPQGRLSIDDDKIHLVSSVAFGPQGTVLASGDWTGQVHLWDVSRKVHLAALSEHAGHVRSVAFSPGGRWLASADDQGAMCLWQINHRHSSLS